MKNLKNSIKISMAIAALLFMGTSKASAQKVELGVRFMPTFSSFEITTPGTGRVKSDFSAGLGFGGFLGYNFTDNIGVQAEVIYSKISQKYSEENVERKINLKYVNIPLLLSLNTGKSRMINFNVVAGPQIGISVGSNLSGVGSDSTLAVLSVKKGDLGVAYGAGLDFGLNAAHTIRLGLGFRGVLGLIDISGDNKTNTTNSYYLLDRSKIKSYSGYVGLSFMF
jgi:hypothetical protein